MLAVQYPPCVDHVTADILPSISVMLFNVVAYYSMVAIRHYNYIMLLTMYSPYDIIHLHTVCVCVSNCMHVC